MKEACVSCRFFVSFGLDTPDLSEAGQCRRHPPQLAITKKQQKAASLHTGEPEFGLFPIVLVDSWCGEYKPNDVTEAKEMFENAKHGIF